MKALLLIIVIIGLGFGAYYFWHAGVPQIPSVNTPQGQNATTSDSTSATGGSAPAQNPNIVWDNGHRAFIVYYNGKSFSPKTVDMYAGESVRVVFTGSGNTMRIVVDKNGQVPQPQEYMQPSSVGKGGTYQVALPQGVWTAYNLNGEHSVTLVVTVH